MKALVGTFNQEKALVGAFSVIVKTGCGTDGALNSTSTKSLQQVLQPPRAVPQVQGEVPCARSVPAQEIGQHVLQGG